MAQVSLFFVLSSEPASKLCRYDFDLKTGKSETGLRTCTYAVQVKPDPESGEEQILMEAPEGGTNWRVVELRPVSEGTLSRVTIVNVD